MARFFVVNLAPIVTEEDLNDLFSEYGDAFARIDVDEKSGAVQGFAYVEVLNLRNKPKGSPRRRPRSLSGMRFHGKVIRVRPGNREEGPTSPFLLGAMAAIAGHVKGGVKVYQRGGAKLYQWTRQHDWERCRGLLKLGPSLSPDPNSSCCYA